FKMGPQGIEFQNRIDGFYNSSKDFEIDADHVWLLRDQFLYQLELADDLQTLSIKKRHTSLNSEGKGINTLKKLDNTLYFVSENHFYSYSKELDAFREDLVLSGLFEGLPIINSVSKDTYGNLW